MADEVILVLTMGRVGSSSVHKSIEQKIGKSVPHIHSISPRILSTQVAKAGGVSRAARSVRDGLDAVQRLVQHQGAVKVVTLVRDAMARNLSAAFAQVRKAYPQLAQLDEFLSTPGEVHRMWCKFHDQRPFVWFDNEIGRNLGIDAYHTPFPDSGIATIVRGRHHVLIMRTELDDAVKSEALAKFIGVDVLPLHIYNDEARTSVYASRYSLFRRSVALDEKYLTEVAKSKYTRHFYSAYSVEEYVAKWLTETRPDNNEEFAIVSRRAS